MSLSEGVLLFGSFAVLAGVPILEELGRTLVGHAKKSSGKREP